jgi:GTP diphosphokinase / guanosine-3',5'-bis(diphosphate) 3'-diphosphatase
MTTTTSPLNKRLFAAARLSEKAHAGQFRKGQVNHTKVPYAVHPARVAGRLIEVGASVDLAIVGYLHDTLEDTELTAAEIETQFGPVVRDLVLELTNDRAQVKEMGKTAYLAQKLKFISPEAVLVKLADRADNASDLWKRKAEGEEANDQDLIDTVAEYVRGSHAMLESVRGRKDCATSAHSALAHAIATYCELASQ